MAGNYPTQRDVPLQGLLEMRSAEIPQSRKTNQQRQGDGFTDPSWKPPPIDARPGELLPALLKGSVALIYSVTRSPGQHAERRHPQAPPSNHRSLKILNIQFGGNRCKSAKPCYAIWRTGDMLTSMCTTGRRSVASCASISARAKGECIDDLPPDDRIALLAPAADKRTGKTHAVCLTFFLLTHPENVSLSECSQPRRVCESFTASSRTRGYSSAP